MTRTCSGCDKSFDTPPGRYQSCKEHVFDNGEARWFFCSPECKKQWVLARGEEYIDEKQLVKVIHRYNAVPWPAIPFRTKQPIERSRMRSRISRTYCICPDCGEHEYHTRSGIAEEWRHMLIIRHCVPCQRLRFGPGFPLSQYTIRRTTTQYGETRYEFEENVIYTKAIEEGWI